MVLFQSFAKNENKKSIRRDLGLYLLVNFKNPFLIIIEE